MKIRRKVKPRPKSSVVTFSSATKSLGMNEGSKIKAALPQGYNAVFHITPTNSDGVVKISEPIVFDSYGKQVQLNQLPSEIAGQLLRKMNTMPQLRTPTASETQLETAAKRR